MLLLHTTLFEFGNEHCKGLSAFAVMHQQNICEVLSSFPVGFLSLWYLLFAGIDLAHVKELTDKESVLSLGVAALQMLDDRVQVVLHKLHIYLSEST